VAHLVWTPDLNTGIDVIDSQHQRIVEYINQVHDARMARGKVRVGEIVDTLVQYTVSHFEFEEALMQDAGYKYTRPHKKVHELFVRRVADFQQRIRAGEDVAEDLLDLLHRWLFSHIRNEDAAYATAVKGNMQVLVEQNTSDGWLQRSLGKFFR
jgi:hemerythrin